MPSSKSQCPSCRESGRDTSEDNLVTFDNGSKKCFACGYSEGSVSIDPRTSIVRMPRTVPIHDGYRGLREETLSRYRVGAEIEKGSKKFSSLTGYTVYPYYDVAGKLVGVKFRDYESEEETGEKHIFYDGVLDLFGWTTYSPEHLDVCLWEGENDALHAAQVDPSRLHLGIPGSSSVKHSVKKNIMRLREFRFIYVCTDNDDAGVTCRNDVLDMLPSYKLRSMFVPQGYKDFSELAESNPKSLSSIYPQMIRTAAPVGGESILTGDELVKNYKEYETDVGRTDIVSTGYEQLDLMLGGGLTRGEVISLVAFTGIGKTSLAMNIAMNALANCDPSLKVMVFGSEMRPEVNMRKLIEIYLQEPYRIVNGQISIPLERRQEALDYISSRIVFYNKTPGDFNEFLDAAHRAVHEQNVWLIVVDVLSDIDDEFFEWQKVVTIMREIVKFANGDRQDRRPPVSFLLVNHTAGSEEELTINSVRGGKTVAQQSTLVLGMTGEIDSDVREVRVLKKSRLQDATVLRTHFKLSNGVYVELKRKVQDEKQTRRSNKGEIGRRLGVRTV